MTLSTKAVIVAFAGILVFAAFFPFFNAGAAGVPIATTISSMGVTSKQAALNATVDSNGEQTAAWFEYGASTMLGIGTDIQLVYGGSGITAVRAQISSLVEGTKYYFRIATQNKYGASYGAIMTFVAQDPSTLTPSNPNGPSVSTVTASYVYQTSANLAGTAYPNSNATRVWFDWGKSNALGNTTLAQSLSNNSVNASYSYVLMNLAPGTTYYYRAVAQNAYGTALGSIASFTTSGSPPAGGSATPPSNSASNDWPSSPTNSNNGIFSKIFAANAKPTDPGSLTLSSELSRTQPWPGGKIEYTIHYTNLGAGTLSALAITTELPEYLRFDSSDIPLREQNKNILVFDLPNLRGRKSESFTIKGIVKESANTGDELLFKTVMTYKDAAQTEHARETTVNASVIAANKAPDLLALVFGNASGSVAQWFLIVSAFIVALAVYNGIRRAFSGFENKF